MILILLQGGIDTLIRHIPRSQSLVHLSSSNRAKGAEDDITAPMACSRC